MAKTTKKKVTKKKVTKKKAATAAKKTSAARKPARAGAKTAAKYEQSGAPWWKRVPGPRSKAS